MGLERLRAALEEGAITRQYSIGERLRKNVYIPPWEALLKQRAELKQPNGQFSPEQQQEHLQETIDVIDAWWRENRENTYWDEHGLGQTGPDAIVQRLVARGQTPKDVAEPDRQKPDAEEQARRDAMLGPPMTPGQVAEAKARLIAHFEQGMAEDAKKNAAIRGEQLGGARVKWAKVREGEWRHEFPSFNNGPLIVVTYTGPEIEQTYDRERPLRGVFQMRQENPDSRVLSNTAEYFYDRLEGAWKRRALGRTGPDAEVQMLDAKGQTSKDLAEAARQKAAAEEQARRDAILDSPMTAEQIADAKDKLIAQLERQQAGRAKQDGSSRGEHLGGERVKWQKVREGQWIYEFPSAGNGPLIVDTYTGPEIEQTAEREYPLRGVFHLQRDDPRHGTNGFRKEFVYQRLGDRWRPGGSRAR